MKSMSSILAVSALLATGATGAAGADPAEDLLKAKNCLGCHAVDKKVVGPAYKDVAAKYKDDKGAEAKLAAALREGKVKGHPPKLAATDDELKTMVKFVLSRK